MRVLLLTHSFNSLAQRLYLELAARGHELSVEFDINDATTAEAVALFRPDLVLAPFLKRAIAEPVWRATPCFIVHPGPPGDRGPSALDWAILRDVSCWGVTVLQATAELDGGPVWATVPFAMRAARKSSLYRNEVTEAAVAAVDDALDRFARGLGPVAPATPPADRWQPPVRQQDRRIDWAGDDTATVVRKIRSADGQPGVEDELLGTRVRLFDAWPEPHLAGRPGTLIARRDQAVCRATRDGAVWIGQVEPAAEGRSFKRPATLALGAAALELPRSEPAADDAAAASGYPGIRYERRGDVGWLHFEFYNGAMSTTQCEHLRAAYADARAQDTRVIVLAGGHDFWSNGLHLNCIEAAASPADESWHNIEAMDDLARDILRTDCQLTVAALQGNAGAGGVFLALAADSVQARRGIVLNPHYRNMGNLYGSEYWTYLLPRRAGAAAASILRQRLPLDVSEAQHLGLVDGCAGPSREAFLAHVAQVAERLAAKPGFDEAIRRKAELRARDERAKPLSAYRAEELERLRLNFYGFDPSYHVARFRFVQHAPHAWTPLYLARHRALAPEQRRA